MSAALGLLRLQQVDSRIDQLEAELERIRAELGNNDLAASAREAMESAGANQSLAENGRQQAEQQASAIRTKLKQAEGALYGGKVQNPKELQDLQAEVASLNKHLIGLDADELAWMEKLEAADAHCRATSVRLEEALHKLGAEHTQLEQRRSELLRKKDSLLSERAATAEAVKPAWHQTYEGLRRTRRGVAVTAVEDGACAACGTALTPATQQNVRHAQDLIPCPSCGRILFAD